MNRRPVIAATVRCAIVLSMGCKAEGGVHAIASAGPTSSAATRTIALAVESDVPLDIRYLRPLSGTELLVADGRSRAMWLLSLDSSALPRQVFRVDRGATGIAGLAVSSEEVGVLLSDASVRVFSRKDWSELRSLPYDSPSMVRPLGIEAGRAGRWWVLAEEMRGVRGGTDRVAVLVLKVLHPRGATIVWEQEKWRLVNMGARANDRSSLSSNADTLLIGGSLPPRLQLYVHDTAAPVRVLLRDVPSRRLTAVDMRAQRRAIETIPPRYRSAVVVQETYPALLKAWRIERGFAIVAAGQGTSVVLDLYCGDAFRGTRFAGVDIMNLWPVPNGIAVLRSAPDLTKYRIDIFTNEQAGLRCE